MRLSLAAAVLLLLASAGCMMPSGQPVVIDRRAGDFWNGNGVLLEMSYDRRHCRVATRSNAFLVEKRWVACRFVHARVEHGN